MKVIIIEDELHTAADLERTIHSIDDEIEVLAILQTVDDAIKFLQKNSVDLIFSDIQLGNELSFDIFAKVNNTTPIIFCTAFDEYALSAFKSCGIEYILKPFKKFDIISAIEKYQSLKDKMIGSNNSFTSSLKNVESIIKSRSGSKLVYHGDKIIPLKIQDIGLFFVENKSTFILTTDSKKYMINENLDALEKSHYPDFFRVNRQFLINRNIVKDVSQYFNRKLIVNINIPFKEKIIVSKLRTTDFTGWLANI